MTYYATRILNQNKFDIRLLFVILKEIVVAYEVIEKHGLHTPDATYLEKNIIVSNVPFPQFLFISIKHILVFHINRLTNF